MNLFRQIEVTTDSIMKIKHTQITLNTAEKNNIKQKKAKKGMHMGMQPF